MLTLGDVLESLTSIRPTRAATVIPDAVIDSRQAIPGSLFVALRGERLDGHDFVADAFRRGASFALIQREVGALRVLDLRVQRDASALEAELAALEVPFCLRVEDTLAALQQIARFWRRKLNVRVVGVTGSVGKSTTKEVIAEVLGRRYRTLKSPGNLNNEIGLPLTILRLGRGYERAVLEMGFYMIGDIAFLCEIALPQVGVLTHIGTSHAERAGSQEAIARGKAELVQALPPAPEGIAILNYDDPWVRPMATQTQARVFYYGLDSAADLWADKVEGLGLEGIRFRLHYRDETWHLHVPMIGRHSVQTALRAAAVGLAEGLTWQEIIAGLQASPTQLRLVAVRAENGALLLDDTYNASPESMLAALNLLAELQGRKVAVLGDMLELGPYEQQGHEIVGIRAAEVADYLVTVGERGRLIAEAARRAGLSVECIATCEDTAQAIEHLHALLQEGDVVLVKGSHGIRMDRIIAALEASS